MRVFNSREELEKEIQTTKYRIQKSSSRMVKNDLSKYLKKLNRLKKKLT